MLVVRRLSGALALLLAVSVLGANVTTAAAADIRFEGHGWGHGVGLSQYGAKAMGADGATYDQILHRYFTEISLVPLSSTERGSFLATETMPFWVGLLQDQSGVVFTVSVESAQLCFDDTDTCVATAAPGETWRFGYDAPERCYFQRATGLGGYARIGPAGSCDASVRPITALTSLFLPRKARSYRDGILRFRWSSTPSRFHVIFQSGVGSYLRGVSAAPDTWSEASLRAQAVTVRSLAAWHAKDRGQVQHLDENRRSDCHCNLYDHNPDPVFRGATGEEAHPNWVAAVNATASEVMRTSDGLALGMYSSSSGGVTENYSDVFGPSTFTHLRSIVDSPAFSISANNPHTAWASSYDQAVIAAAYGFSWISNLTVLGRNYSGSAATVQITGIRNGRPVVVAISAVDLRLTLSLRSTSFDILTIPRFEDVSTEHVFAGEVMGLVELGITQGCSTDRFCPNESVTRGQMAAFLTRALDLDSPTNTDSFDDDDGSIFENDIEALYAAGITRGCTINSFCPSLAVSRGEMAAFLVRAFDLSGPGGDPFTDDDGSYFEPEIGVLEVAGVSSGCAPNQYCPDGLVTRGEMAAFLIRALAAA